MFTGIITAIGQITQADTLGQTAQHGLRLQVQAPPAYLNDVQVGDSIALSGACMTVLAFDPSTSQFVVDVSQESLAHTTGLESPGSVNLEKAMRLEDRLGGHVVSGHVQGTAQVLSVSTEGESRKLVFALPEELALHCVAKGSITLNGVSLTINELIPPGGGSNGLAHNTTHGTRFTVNLIAHTQTHTTLGQLKPGDGVNVETDVMARHVARLVEAALARRPMPTQW